MSLTSWATSESGCHSRKLGSADIFNIRLSYVLQLCVPVRACFWTIRWLKCSGLTIKPKTKKPPPPPELFLQLLSILLLTSEEWQLIWAPIMLWVFKRRLKTSNVWLNLHVFRKIQGHLYDKHTKTSCIIIPNKAMELGGHSATSYQRSHMQICV